MDTMQKSNIRLTEYSFIVILLIMKSIKVYQCLCDETRLRILNLLMDGPLCVCHLSTILGVPQPKVSRHLKALRDGKALQTQRCHNWTICRLPETPSPLLEANLKCLQDLRQEEWIFQEDLKKRERTVASLQKDTCIDLPEAIRSLAIAYC
jgi:DNA-binding transcriptional ArsR family regulator